MNKSIYEFRHVEERLSLLEIASGIASLFAIRYSVSTLNWFILLQLIILTGLVVFVIVHAMVINKYSRYLPRIINGKKRLLKHSVSISLCIVTLSYAVIIISNMHFPSDNAFYKEAKVISVSSVLGPKLYGWDARIEIEGSVYYQMVSYGVYEKLQSSEIVTLKLRKGFWGLSFIESVK